VNDAKLNPAIVDAIANTNIDVLGNAPAIAVSQVYQVLAHSIGLSMQTSQANHAGMMHLGTAIVSVGITKILEKIK
jgi:Killing trait